MPRHILGLVRAALALIGVCALALPTARAEAGRVVFRGNRGESYEIYSMYADGSNLRNLSDLNWAADDMPDISPDGTRVVFSSTRDIGDQIYVMNADGSGQRRLTAGSDVNWHPQWSPDGARILFYRLGSGLYIMDADGQHERWLADSRAGGDWSPDGARIVYRDPAHRDLMTISPNGADMTPVGIRGLDPWLSSPAWSPDGLSIAFTQKRDPGSEVFTVNADGTRVRNRTQMGRWAREPAWTSDGARIVFSAQADGGTSLFTMLADGGDIQRLTHAAGHDSYVSWHGGSDLTRAVAARGKWPVSWGWLRSAGVSVGTR